MNPTRLPFRLFWVVAVALVMAGLGWLAFGLAGNHAGRHNLPDEAGSTVAFLPDPGGRRTVEDVMATPPETWRTSTGESAIEARHGEVLWVRVFLRNPGAEALRGVLQDTELYVDEIDTWMATERDGGWRRERLGESRSAAERPWWSLTPAFLVEVPARSERVIYLRESDYYYPKSHWRWWPKVEDYFSAQFREVLVRTLCLGWLVALCLYNAVLWVRLRFPDMGCYLGYAVAMTVFNLAESGGLSLCAGAPWRMVIEAASLAASTWFLIKFARLFLETTERMPRFDRGLSWLGGAFGVVFAGTLTMPWFGQAFWLGTAVLGTAAAHALLLGTALVAWKRGQRSARFFIAAFGVLYAGGLPAAILWERGSEIHGVMLGLLASSTLEMLLLSFAVADRFARLQRERAEAQQRLVEETEQRRAMQEAYSDELQLEVSERTRELQAANADKDRMLTLLGHDLRSPLTAMTQTAEQLRRHEQASPAQSFARDVADAGRQMLLLIEDVVLWSRLRVGDTPAHGWHDADLVINQAVRLHRTQADRRQVEIVSVAEPGHSVQTDLVLAQALLRNLVGNAVKFARTRVTVTAERVADGMCYLVRDDGPGLPVEVLERLRTGGATGEERGFGLRLCREIAASLDVTIEVASPADGGTEMSVTLPVRATSNLPMEVRS